jgi:hypothetical protein
MKRAPLVVGQVISLVVCDQVDDSPLRHGRRLV